MNYDGPRKLRLAPHQKEKNAKWNSEEEDRTNPKHIIYPETYWDLETREMIGNDYGFVWNNGRWERYEELPSEIIDEMFDLGISVE